MSEKLSDNIFTLTLQLMVLYGFCFGVIALGYLFVIMLLN